MDQKITEPSLKERIPSRPRAPNTLWTKLKRIVKAKGAKETDHINNNPGALVELIDLSSQGGPIYYHNYELLGEGGFAKVYKGFSVQGKEIRPVAIKLCKWSDVKELVKDEELGEVPLEVYILKHLPDHPVAIKFYHYQKLDETRYAIVMERPENSVNLYELRGESGFPFSDEKASKLVKDLTSFLKDMLDTGVAYRDLKVTNIIYDLDNHTIKLVDYGLACFYEKGKPFTKFYGTESHMPPEFKIMKMYSATSGMAWCLGFVAYFLLTGCLAFTDPDQAILKMKIGLPWNHVRRLSKDALCLLYQLFCIYPQSRATFDQILQHRWTTGRDRPNHPSEESSSSNSWYSCLASFCV